MIGIYGIQNQKNKKIYVGQSKQIKKRWSRHLKELEKNKHNNKHLLRSYKKYGKENFVFFILEECSKEELNIKEEKWINSFPRKQLYNKNFYIVDLSGERNPFFGKKHNKKTRKKLSEINKKNIGEKNSNFGKKWTIEQKKQMH